MSISPAATASDWATRCPAAVLQKDSRSAAVVEELVVREPGDVRVDKYRMSAFRDTPLERILRNLGVSSVSFVAVNPDQWVMATLQDANWLGYDCLLPK